MPICRECHSRISTHDKDMCPVCGCLHPLDGEGAVASETIEMTQQLDGTDPTLASAEPRKKTKTLLYFALVGWLGIGFSYLRFKLQFVLLWALCNIVIIGGVGSLFLLVFKGSTAFVGYLISLGIVYLVNICIGLVYRFKPNMKDHSGELIL